MTTNATQPQLFETSASTATAPFNRHSMTLICCPCNNNTGAYAETQPSPASIYGFKTVVTVQGFGKLDHFSNVVCKCGRKHSIKAFISKFHNAAVKSGAYA